MEISDLIRGLLEAYPDGAKVTLTVDIEPKNMTVLPVTAETAKPQSVSPTTDDILAKVKEYEAKRLESKKSVTAESDETNLTQESEPCEKKHPGRPARKTTIDLDMGKVKALRAAGWSYAKIADEMRCSAQTIVNKLKAEEAESND